MAAPDMDVIKEIPGYKVIMKAILKMQIQQLVEQLASHTDEESVILTASVSDGTLSHLGSDSGKNFLEDHEDIKSQFLGFCLKRHHKKKQQEKERESLTSPPKMGGPPPMRFQGSPRYGNPRMPIRSPNYSGAPGVHPVSLSRASQGAQMRSPRPRHEPYPMNRPPRRPSFNLDQPGPSGSAMKLPLGNKIDNQIIKIEPDDDNTNGSDSNTPKPADTNTPSSSQPSSPAIKNSETPQPTEKDDEATNSSTSTIPNEPSDLKFSDTAPAEGLSLDSDFSNLISSELNVPGTPDSQNKSGAEEPKGDIDPDVNVKVEAITESEMELEITGVELGHGSSGDPMASQESWAPPPGGAAGTMADMPLPGAAGQLGYTAAPILKTGQSTSSVGNAISTIIEMGFQESQPRRNSMGNFVCPICGLDTKFASHYDTHMRIHTGEKPFVCKHCGKGFSRNWSLKTHVAMHLHKS